MVIHLTGADTYRSAKRLTQLKQAFQTKHDPRGLNMVTLDGANMTAEELRNAITTVGFFSVKRFIAIDNYQSDNSSVKVKELQALLEPIAESVEVIVVVRENFSPSKSRARNVKKKTKKAIGVAVVNSFVKNEKLEDFPAMSDGEMATWVIAEAKKLAGQISLPVANRLVMLCNRDSWRVANELNKIISYVGDRPVELTDVETMVATEFASDIFSLTDALGQRQTGRALDLLHRELAAGINPQALISILAGHIRNLLQVGLAKNRGEAPAAIATTTNLHPYVIQKALHQSALFTADQLRRWHHQLLTIDHTLKTSPLDAETLLDLMILKV